MEQRYSPTPKFNVGDYVRTNDGVFGWVMAHFVTIKGRGRVYILEDSDEQLALTGEKYIELLLEAPKVSA